MVKKLPSPAEWEAAYKAGATAKGSKWQTNFLGATGIAAAAASDTAQATYDRKMSDPAVRKVRQIKLKGLSDADFQNPVRVGGSGLYTAGVNAKSAKASKGVAPYLDEIARILPTLPAKTDDPMTNLTQRAGPIVTGLHAKKMGA